jgi:hypothetical protein
MSQPHERTTSEVQLKTRTAVGVFEDAEQAKAAARQLQDAGYREAISVVGLEGKAFEESVHDTQATRGGVTGAAAGAILGGIALGVASVAVPGVGTVIAGGPLVAILAGAFAGASAGGLVGSFVGMGITTEHAKRYEEAVRRGNVVVTVDTSGNPQADGACMVMRGSGATEVASYDAML